MKNNRSDITIKALSLLTALALPTFGMAQSQTQNNERSSGLRSDSQSSDSSIYSNDRDSGSQWGSSSQVSKVSEGSLENQITADRLIGKQVVDRDGQKIGKVKDIGLSVAFNSNQQNDTASASYQWDNQSSSQRSGQSASATGQQNRDQNRNSSRSSNQNQSSGQSDTMYGGDVADSNQAETPYGDAAGNPSQTDSLYGDNAAGAAAGTSSQSGARTGGQASANRSGASASGQVGTGMGSVSGSAGTESGGAGYTIGSTDDGYDSAQQRSTAGNLGTAESTPGSNFGASGGNEINLYISSENDEILEIPASLLTYNEQEDQLELNMSKSELDAISARAES